MKASRLLILATSLSFFLVQHSVRADENLGQNKEILEVQQDGNGPGADAQKQWGTPDQSKQRKAEDIPAVLYNGDSTVSLTEVTPKKMGRRMPGSVSCDQISFDTADKARHFFELMKSNATADLRFYSKKGTTRPLNGQCLSYKLDAIQIKVAGSNNYEPLSALLKQKAPTPAEAAEASIAMLLTHPKQFVESSAVYQGATKDYKMASGIASELEAVRAENAIQ